MIRRFVLIAVLSLVAAAATAADTGEKGVTLHYFWGEGCPHCAKAKPFVAELAKRHPRLQVRDYEVFKHQENLELLMGMARKLGEEATGVPTFILGGEMFSGFSAETARQIEERVSQCLSATGSGNAAAGGKGTTAAGGSESGSTDGSPTEDGPPLLEESTAEQGAAAAQPINPATLPTGKATPDGVLLDVNPAMAAVAGLVPWAESGMRILVRLRSPRSTW